jgi:hypothetical protein
MSTPSLFDAPRARMSDPATSHGAALSALPSVATNRQRALDAHRNHPSGLTDFELAEVTGIAQTSIGVRRHELCKQGCIEALVVDGRRVTRPSPSGTPSQVWRIVS